MGYSGTILFPGHHTGIDLLTLIIFGGGEVVPVLLTDHHAMKAYWGVGV
jgi:hypothetical protein